MNASATSPQSRYIALFDDISGNRRSKPLPTIVFHAGSDGHAMQVANTYAPQRNCQVLLLGEIQGDHSSAVKLRLVDTQSLHELGTLDMSLGDLREHSEIRLQVMFYGLPQMLELLGLLPPEQDTEED